MKISLSDAGKRFNRDWIFRHLSFEFHTGTAYAIVGPNGSGKSTLLQALSGSIHINEGSIDYQEDGRSIAAADIYRDVAICAPYLEIVEEMTLREFLEFHNGFKPFLPGVEINYIIDVLGLRTAADKQIRNFSSGMKQRVKLAQSIFSNTALLLLDEPCTNLDSSGIRLYHDLIRQFSPNRLTVVSSNDRVEYEFCQETILISQYK